MKNIEKLSEDYGKEIDPDHWKILAEAFQAGSRAYKVYMREFLELFLSLQR